MQANKNKPFPNAVGCIETFIHVPEQVQNNKTDHNKDHFKTCISVLISTEYNNKFSTNHSCSFFSKLKLQNYRTT